ncbi:hypothetical protein ACWC4D_23405 [Streptomyces sp. NPDC001288]|uniref:hypothetical protein n=1 Tax=unclassified Streptomyces TaxID=2593676 RepID=UPI00331D4E8F
MSSSEHRAADDALSPSAEERVSDALQGAAPPALPTRPPVPRRVPGDAGRRPAPQDLATHRPDTILLLRVQAGLKRLV